MKPVQVSCLCVTEGRAAFWPWLLWNYRKQTLRSSELVVVDSSPGESFPAGEATVVRCPPGTGVSRKRNLALAAASGTVIAWMDDDDWQHPRRLELLVAALAGGGDVAGHRHSWFVDLEHGRARRYDGQRLPVFNGLGVRRGTLTEIRFDETRLRAADTAWVTAVLAGSSARPVFLPELLSCWLCHRQNLSNPASRYVFPTPLAGVADAVGSTDWAETEDQLVALRGRLSGIV